MEGIGERSFRGLNVNELQSSDNSKDVTVDSIATRIIWA